jgi:bifunctional non-homologous end joining protein LigD
MEATAGDEPFDDPDFLFEPWWPGARAFAFVEAGHLRMQVAGLADPMTAFPELGDLPSQVLGDGIVLDGTLLVVDELGRPDGDLLRRRLGGSKARAGRPAAADRAGEGPGAAGGPRALDAPAHPGRPAYVASDLVWSDGVSWARRPFRARRDRLTAVLPAGDRVIVGRGYVNEGTVVAEALTALGIEGLSARRLSARYRAGRAGDAWLRVPLVPPEPRPRPTLALILRLPLELD